MNKSELKEFLDEKVNLYNNPKFIESDPIQIPHLFSVKEDIEIPSDLHGVLYQRYDKEGAWKSKLMKEMQAVGIFVDMKAVIESL